MGENATLTKRQPFWINGWLLFALISAVYLGISLFIQAYVLTDEVYIQSFTGQLPAERVEAWLSLREEWQWLGYALSPVLIALKVAYTAFCLAVGFVLVDHYEVSLQRLFKVALVAEVVFIAAAVFHIVWAEGVVDIQTLEEFSTAYPLSMLVFFDAGSLPGWARYPLQTVNLFVILYCVALGYLLAWQHEERPDDMFVLALGSYGTGLLLWVAFVAFLTLQIS